MDVGGGEAETVVYLCQNTSTKRVLKFGAWRARDTLDEVARFLDPYLKRLNTVRVDAIGIGHNFGLYLQKKGFPVDLVNVAVPCENKPELGNRTQTHGSPTRRHAFIKALPMLSNATKSMV